MKRHKQAEAVLNRFFAECGDAAPSQGEIAPVLDRVWERLEWRADEFEGARAPAAPARPFRFAWAVGIVLIAVFVNALVWRQGLPFSVAVKTGKPDEHSMSKSSSRQTRETLQLTAPQDAFELASVKLVARSSEAFKLASMGETMQLAWIGCPGGYAYTTRLDPGRLTIPGASVLSLVLLAYGRDCTLVDGGPAWARSGEYYEIQALLPEGTPRETIGALLKGDAPQLQRMLQTLLADRFRLVLKRELRETPVYALTVASPGKMKLSPEERLPPPASFPAIPGPAPTVGRGGLLRLPGLLFAHAVSMSDLAKELRLHAGRIVVDKTGRSDVFDVDLKFAPNTSLSVTATPPVPPQSIPPLPGAPSQSTPTLQGASLQDALEEQLGLKLEAARMPLEILVIESVERPSEN